MMMTDKMKLGWSLLSTLRINNREKNKLPVPPLHTVANARSLFAFVGYVRLSGPVYYDWDKETNRTGLWGNHYLFYESSYAVRSFLFV